jgi:hypothetical protein
MCESVAGWRNSELRRSSGPSTGGHAQPAHLELATLMRFALEGHGAPPRTASQAANLVVVVRAYQLSFDTFRASQSSAAQQAGFRKIVMTHAPEPVV